MLKNNMAQPAEAVEYTDLIPGNVHAYDLCDGQYSHFKFSAT